MKFKMLFFQKDKLPTSFERAKAVSYFMDASALVYHIMIFFVFMFNKVYPMMFYNILSISVFAVLLFSIKKCKNFITVYFIALTEVVIHQIAADYFIGTDASFHYFILLMGVLPFFIFEDRFKVSIINSIFTSILFIIIENFSWESKYPISSLTICIIRTFNITITIFMIINMMLIFMWIVFKTEKVLAAKNTILENEIKMASVIQQSFFKQDISDITNYQISYFCKPMAGVSGDIYDFYKRGNKLDGLGFFDVSGHGISSGLVTMLVKNIIHQEFYKRKNLELWEIMDNINRRVISEKGDIENYLTGILLRTTKENQLEISIAGHPFPIIYRKAENSCQFFKPKNSAEGVIGIGNIPVLYTSDTIDFNEGDELILFSDGVTDACNSKMEVFGAERLLQTAKSVISETLEKQVSEINRTIEEFREKSSQNDDITFLILKK